MSKRYINYQVVIENASFLLFGCSIFYLVITKKYLTYVTPRMGIYLYFTLFIIAIWFIVNLKNIYITQHEPKTLHSLVLFIPVLVLLMSEPSASITNISQRYIAMNSYMDQEATEIYLEDSKKEEQETIKEVLLPIEKNQMTTPQLTENQIDAFEIDEDVQNQVISQEEKVVSADGYLSVDSYGNSIELHGYNAKEKSIKISNEEFYLWISEFYMNMKQFEGFQVSMVGFVFRDATIMKATEFVPARLMMTCCVADLTTIGMLCQYEGAGTLPLDSWVMVEGSLVISQFDGKSEPQLKVSCITEAEPVDDYIYPF